MKRWSIVALLALSAVAAIAFGGVAFSASDYPTRPIHWIVPYPPGGTTDVIARVVAQAMGQLLGQPIVVDNHAGAGGQVAMNTVAKSNADGYTLLVSDASLATAPSLYKELQFDPVKDLRAVAMFATVPHIVVVNPAVEAKSLAELVALGKKTELHFASGGVGSPLHLAGEALRLQTGITWTHIPYRGAGPAILAVLSNEAQVATPSLPAALSFVQSGKLRALAVMSPKRLAALPDVPTVAELGYPEATVVGWVGLHAPAATPADIVSTLEGAAGKALEGSELRAQLTSQGADVRFEGSASYGDFVAHEMARWKKVVQAAGIEPQ